MTSPSDSARRVVITGAGVVSPLGNSTGALWSALSQRRSGVDRSDAFLAAGLPMSFAAEARDFTGRIDDFGPLPPDVKKSVRKGLKVMNRESQMGIAAAFAAWHDAGLDAAGHDPERAGICFGSDYMLTEPTDFNAGVALCAPDGQRFDYERWGGDGMRQLTPLWLLKYLPNMPACHVAIYKDLRGPSNSITQREASSDLAVADARWTIVRGKADVMIAGATGTRVHPMKAIHALQQEQVATNGCQPAEACRPFDLDRTGMVLGEGSGALLLEELEHARARGATVYAEVVGTGSSSVIDRNFVADRGRALVNAMRGALRSADRGPADIDHVQAHGLGTKTSDAEEARAIREVFGEHSDQLRVTAAKSYFGNLGAGSGAVELIAALLALKQRQLFPVLNFRTPDPECRLPGLVSDEVDAGTTSLHISVTPQGQAACVIMRALA